MVTVRQLMNAKGSQDTHSVGPEDTVYTALQLMAEKNISAVVVSQGDQLVGIFTERDHLRKISLKDRSPRETQLQQIMSREMITVAPSFSLETCMELMHEHHIRHLPVVEDGRLVGVVSMRDVVDAILSTQQNRIQFLESTLTGTEYPKA